MKSLGDGLERAANGAGTGMMIDQGGGAAADRLQQGGEGTPVAVLEGEGLVEPPPEIVKHRLERLRRHGFGQSAREGTVAVGMGVDKAGHEDFSGRVDGSDAGGDCKIQSRLLTEGLVRGQCTGRGRVTVSGLRTSRKCGAECSGGCGGLYHSRLDEEGVIVEHPAGGTGGDDRGMVDEQGGLQFASLFFVQRGRLRRGALPYGDGAGEALLYTE